MENKEYDYASPILQASAAVSKQIIAMIPKFQDVLLAPINTNQTPEEAKADKEVRLDFGIEVLKLIAASGLPFEYVSFPMQNIIVMLDALIQHVEGDVSGKTTELLALTIGAKSKATGQYRREDATYTDLCIALANKRTELGTTEEEYLNMPKKEEAAPESTPEAPAPVAEETAA